MTEPSITVGVVPFAPVDPPQVLPTLPVDPPGDPLTPDVPVEGVPGRNGDAAGAPQNPALLYLSLLAGHTE